MLGKQEVNFDIAAPVKLNKSNVGHTGGSGQFTPTRFDQFIPINESRGAFVLPTRII